MHRRFDDFLNELKREDKMFAFFFLKEKIAHKRLHTRKYKRKLRNVKWTGTQSRMFWKKVHMNAWSKRWIK